MHRGERCALVKSGSSNIIQLGRKRYRAKIRTLSETGVYNGGNTIVNYYILNGGSVLAHPRNQVGSTGTFGHSPLAADPYFTCGVNAP